MSLALVFVLLVALGHAEATLQQYPFRNTSQSHFPSTREWRWANARTVQSKTASEGYFSMRTSYKLVLLTVKLYWHHLLGPINW